MPTYVIERELPGADKLKAIAAKSNKVAAGLGEPYRWVTTYVAGDKFYCVHEAESAETVFRHAREGGFPIHKVTELAAEIGPSTADGAA